MTTATVPKAKVLVVDDEQPILNFIERALAQDDYEVKTCTDSGKGMRLFTSWQPDVVITDIVMEPFDGIEMLKRVKTANPDANVVVITAHASIDNAVSAIRGGASDYLTKPFKIEELRETIQRTLSQKRLVIPTPEGGKSLQAKYHVKNLVGQSQLMQEVQTLIARIAKTDSTVLIIGESGTGKEVVSRAIHYNSLRKTKPFVSINCAALPEQLLESELFGHEKGSFTGATSTKIGLMELAEGGTFFLDEVGETSTNIQVKLLRVLQEREVRRVGGLKDVPVNIRVVASTSRNLADAIAQGKFRQDFYYRLNVIPIFMPPLRERIEDIPLLIDYFVKLYTARAGIKRQISFAADAAKYFQAYDWPGNIRELENIVERVMTLSDQSSIDRAAVVKILGKELTPGPREMTKRGALVELKDATQQFERSLIAEVLKDTSGNKFQAAKRLNLSRQALQYKLKKYNLA